MPQDFLMVGPQDFMMVYVWSGICSAVISIFVVSLMYFICIKPNVIKPMVYQKVIQESDIES